MPITKLMNGLPSRTMQQAEFDAASEKLMAELPTWGAEANALSDNVNAKEAAAAVSAATASSKASAASASADDALSRKNAAAASAAAADASAVSAQASAVAAQGTQLTGTSATSLVIGTGPKVFVTQGGKQWPQNVPIIAVSAADASKYMAGITGSYSGTSLTINVTSVGGLASTAADWIISTAGARGAPGATASNTQFDVIPVAALDLDLSLGNYFTKTINANSSFTFSNPPAQGFSFSVELEHVSGTVTLPASVKAPGDLIPSLQSGKTHLFMFVTKNGGARWRMSILPNYIT